MLSKMKSLSFLLGLLIVLAGCYASVGALAPFVAPYPKGSFQPLYEGAAGESPSWRHPFGVDAAGHDLFSEAIHGTRNYLGGAFLILVALVFARVLLIARLKRKTNPQLDKFLHK
jgi:peptide/nickel transport system permease protein